MPALDAAEARRRFGAARVARLATVDAAGRPHLVPVVFAGHAVDGTDRLVTAVDHKPKTTARLKRLGNIAAHPSVCLLADAYDENWDQLWWVRADGEAHVLPPDAAEPAVRHAHETAVRLLCAKYPQYRDHPPGGPVIAVTVRRWTGWEARAR
ncbi:TIGR03668 family PPOX class F420-dependent oxidoreductase [Streptomyces diastatochromogenes]|uniref:PPOX class F420-dependent oxidoreductase n=1 Tax=Streptomyces diastatochromogenes TaxID=42236 RepID=A0A233S786_STRDA|nr:TIGR03668 family PPOX class F420-dependent oxidoreductase [Streptomyces diastatochromogenes]MCZ0986146.1 TIGR03668 family PPOX class F420-dependent oxidoreductase [Streptomyces diastatochromogenes]OXY91429.1 PPOX class F420-dependent oxidoreductase [Streptomyces diastatochromogenes]